MKIYEIIDEEISLSIGFLLYYEREKSYVIELNEVDEWTAPLIFSNKVKSGNFSIGRELTKIWINERVIPSGRQNINSILANAKMQYYDEMILLEKSSARCSQDSMYIKQIDYVPDLILKRNEHYLRECTLSDDFNLLCFFNDGKVNKINLRELVNDTREVNKVLSNEKVFFSGHIAAGGFCLTFNDSIDIEAVSLYSKGVAIPVTYNDFVSFVNNIVDTSECCDIMNCSRQNLTNYISNGLLKPIKTNVKGNLYTKGSIYNLEKKTKNNFYKI